MLVSGRVSHLPSWGSPLTSLHPSPAPDHVPGGSVPICCICWLLGSLWVAMDKTTQTQKPQGFDLGGWLDGVGVTENKALGELDSAAPASPQRLHPSLFPHPQSPPLGHPEPLYFPRAWPPRPLLPLRENSSPSPLCVQSVLFALRDQSRHHALHPASCSHPITATTKLVSGFSLYSQGLAV